MVSNGLTYIRVTHILLLVAMAEGHISQVSRHFRRERRGFLQLGQGMKSNAQFLPVGETLELNCSSAKADGKLWIEQGNASLSDEFVRPLEDTGIRVVIPEVTLKNSGMYYCFQNNRILLGAKEIHVGYLPEAPRFTGCVSENFENMTCNWDPVRTDLGIPTIWTIEYFIDSTVQQCEFKGENPTLTCLWPSSDPSDQRLAFKPGFNYIITATARNNLGATNSTQEVRPVSLVKPTPVSDLSSASLNSSAVELKWTLTFPLYFPDELIYSVTAAMDQSPRARLNMTGTVNKTKPNRIVVGDLFPYSDYTFWVRVKPKGSGFWSEARQTGDRTKEAVAEAGPALTPSSFTDCPQGGTARQVYLYWQTPGPHIAHGVITGYDVTLTDLHTKATESARSRPMLVLDTEHEYRVDIRVMNSAGISRNYSTLFLPKSSKVLRPGVKVASENNGSHVIVSWEDVPSGSSVISFTVHYCKGKLVYANTVAANCSTSYGWQTVDKLQRSLSLTLDNPGSYVFGVSVDTDEQSSDIVWARCLFRQGKVPGKITGVMAGMVDKYSVELRWRRLVCGQSAVSRVLRYDIGYSSEDETTCDKGKRLVIRGDFEVDRALVPGLYSVTPYRMCVRAVTGAGLGPWSDSLSVKTALHVYIIAGVISGILGLIVIIVGLCCLWKKYKSTMKIEITMPEYDDVDSSTYGDSSGQYRSAEYQALMSNGTTADVSGSRRHMGSFPLSSAFRDSSVAPATSGSRGTDISLPTPSTLSEPLTPDHSLDQAFSPCVSYSRLALPGTGSASEDRISSNTTIGDSGGVSEYTKFSERTQSPNNTQTRDSSCNGRVKTLPTVVSETDDAILVCRYTVNQNSNEKANFCKHKPTGSKNDNLSMATDDRCTIDNDEDTDSCTYMPIKMRKSVEDQVTGGVSISGEDFV